MKNIDVEFSAAKPNPAFSPWQLAITKFLLYTQPVKCAYCGKLKKRHWTQLKFFRVSEGFEKKLPNGKVVKSQSFKLTDGAELFPPLTPVCEQHILSPQ